jgi:hypothetical protein
MPTPSTPPSRAQPVPPLTGSGDAPAAQPSGPPKAHGELDRRTLQAARTFDMLLRNGQTWRGVQLVEMDSWSVLLEVPDQGRVLVPKHAVDAYLLGRPR